MENKWLTFRAKLHFSSKDNKVSVEIVRLHNSNKETSDWRMDPASATNGNQWFTIKGRWVGKPLSFEFAQTDAKVITVPKMMTKEATEKPDLEEILHVYERNENRQTEGTASTHGDPHKDEQVELTNVNLDYQCPTTGYGNQSDKGYSGEEAVVPRPEDETSHKDFPGKLVSNTSRYGHDTLEKPDQCPATGYGNHSQKIYTSGDSIVYGKLLSNTSRDGHDTLEKPDQCPATGYGNQSQNIYTSGYSIVYGKLLSNASRDGHDTLEKPDQCPATGYGNQSDKSYISEEGVISRPIDDTSHKDFPAKLVSNFSRDRHNTLEKSLLNIYDICPHMNASFNASSNTETSEQVTYTEDKAPFTLTTVMFWRQTSQPKCTLFGEYNASYVAQDMFCIDTQNQPSRRYPIPNSFKNQQPLKRSILELHLSDDEASADVSSDATSDGMLFLDDDCASHSPTRVLIGAATDVTVTVTIVISYVMMACPRYFWAR